MEVVEAYQIRLESVMDSIDMKTFGLMAAIGKIELDNFRERAYRTGEDAKPETVLRGRHGQTEHDRRVAANNPLGYGG